MIISITITWTATKLGISLALIMLVGLVPLGFATEPTQPGRPLIEVFNLKGENVFAYPESIEKLFERGYITHITNHWKHQGDNSDRWDERFIEQFNFDIPFKDTEPFIGKFRGNWLVTINGTTQETVDGKKPNLSITFDIKAERYPITITNGQIIISDYFDSSTGIDVEFYPSFPQLHPATVEYELGLPYNMVRESFTIGSGYMTINMDDIISELLNENKSKELEITGIYNHRQEGEYPLILSGSLIRNTDFP